MMMSGYDLSPDHYLKRAQEDLRLVQEDIRLAQQVQQREQDEKEEKEETIKTLRKKVEILDAKCRSEELRQRTDEKFSDILANNKYLARQLSHEQAENKRLKEEATRVKQELSAKTLTITYLEEEKEKADHIIKNLLRQMTKLKQVS